MSAEDELPAGGSSGPPAVTNAHRELLESIVEVARAIFVAKASSIMLFDEEAGELEFAAVAGEGADRLMGTRFPATRGIAGWVLAAGQPLVIEDVGADPRFARDVAERSGYVPKGLMAAPLHSDGGALGVLQVLDRPARSKFSLRESEILGLFAEQAAIALQLVRNAEAARASLERQHGDAAVLARLASTVGSLQGDRRRQAIALLESLEAILRSP